MSVSLESALSGLKAAQRQLDTISTNIANAGNDGYTRKLVPMETLTVNGVGLGVRTQAILRNVDTALLRDLARQTSVVSNAEVRNKYLERIQQFHGASDANRSLSAEIGKLSDAFAALSSAPDNALALSSVITAAERTAGRFNEFSSLLTSLRNQTEEEISYAIGEVNTHLEKIADFNVRISQLSANGQSTAELEDQRDVAIREVSKYVQISTFTSENKKITVMTKQGQTLADTTARKLSFTKSNLVPGSYYPGGGANGVFLNGTPPLEITTSGIGGQIGALIDMRDKTIPVYQAQADEMAQKLAARMDMMGLRLFTDGNGNMPANTDPPAVGFSADIRVNRDIIADPTLLRSGTTGAAVLPGSNEIIRKITEFAFGPFSHQQALGVDISVGTIFGTTSMTQINRLTGTVDITDYTPDLDAAPNITTPASFTLTIGATPYNITINPGHTALDLVASINAAVGSTVASLNGLGQLVLNAGDTIDIADNGIGAGIGDLGLSFGTYAASNPSFTVQVGTQSPVTIVINPGDTQVQLLAALNLVPGLTASLDGSGRLLLVPTEGGDLKLANTNGQPTVALGLTISNMAHTPFRQTGLGPDGSISTGLLSNSTLEDFARSMITAQSQDSAQAKDKTTRETTFQTMLDTRHKNESGVDIDREMAELIRIQTAYTAAARMITATERLFDDLLQAFGI